MARQVREIIRIDGDLCDGCGQCILSCAEGALKIIDGKARLVSENLCDGFGNCLGSCPQDAITIIKREADDFDEEAVKKHLTVEEDEAKTAPAPPVSLSMASNQPPAAFGAPHSGGCPGSAMRTFRAPAEQRQPVSGDAGELPSTLSQWPVQLMLVPPTAPFLRGREILLTADCCPFAYADFHRKLLAGKALLVGCPKLDNLDYYRQKLAQIFSQSGCTAVTVVMMEVPCCGGLKMVVQQALRDAGVSLPVNEIVIGVTGNILEKKPLAV